MKKMLHVINSDAPNLYGDKFTPGALISGLCDSCVSGMPLFIAHDFSRLVGWDVPQSIYFEPGLTRLIDVGYLAEDHSDYQELQNRFVHHLYSNIKDNPDTKHLHEKMQGYLTSEAKLIINECIAFVDKELTSRIFPDLVNLQDKDGLIPLSVLESIGPGVFKIGEFAIFAHQFFRRNLFRLNTLNYPFLNQLQQLTTTQLIPRIALDPDMVGLASTYNGGRMELAYWWGPKFNDKLDTIPIGVTRHDANENDILFHGLSRTEFRWGSRAKKHIFEAEELRDSPTRSESNEKFGCRYVHSIVSEVNGKIEHLDGSIRMYSEQEMLERLEIDLAHATRDTEYTKLWRIDAPISISDWKGLISDYYRDNFQVGEYLGAEKLDKNIWNPQVKPNTIESQYIPYSIRPEDGLRISVTFISSEDVPSVLTQTITPLDFITNGREKFPYVESDAIEVKKAFKRLGLNLEVDASTKFVSFGDKYLNLPLLVLPSHNLTANLDTTLNALGSLLKSWINNENKQIVSINFRYPVDQMKDVQLSIIGWVTELLKWMSNPLSRTPISTSGWDEWADKVASYLGNNYRENLDRVPIFNLLQSTGILLIKRERIEYDQLTYDVNDYGIGYNLRLLDNMSQIANELINHNIIPGFSWIILNGICTKCGNSYFQCGCSKLLDKGVSMVIKEVLPASLFWTDKPAPMPFIK